MRTADVLQALATEIATVKSFTATIEKVVPAKSGGFEVTLTESSKSLDEAYEDTTAWWGPGTSAAVLSIHPDKPTFVLREVVGMPPRAGSKITLYPPKYLARLQEIWQDPARAGKALAVWEAVKESKNLTSTDSTAFGTRVAGLREKQKESFKLLQRRVGFLWGPPGTGKTHTLGALIATLLLERPTSRVLLLATTNRAVDGALISVDRRLQELGANAEARQLRKRIKRYGSHFEAARYEREDRGHLVVKEAQSRVLLQIADLEEGQPDKSNTQAYSDWKERLRRLRAQIPKPDLSARLLAMTTTAAAFAYDPLESTPFDYVIFDEASQLSLPYACALGALGKKVLFAGDDCQLAPIVVAEDKAVQDVLALSPFSFKTEANTCQLNEQDRMAPEICDLVADMFYEGNLRAAEGSELNEEWKAERMLRDLPRLKRNRLHIEVCHADGAWITLNGKRAAYRPASADQAVALAQECCEGGIPDIAILTPFRKQRQEINSRLRRLGLTQVKVATVHAVQGDEFNTVMFDATLGEEIKEAGSLLCNELEAKRLVNVAISRAKSRFIFIVSPADLRRNRVLRSLGTAMELHTLHLETAPPPLETSVAGLSRTTETYVTFQGQVAKAMLSPRDGYFVLAKRSGEQKEMQIKAFAAVHQQTTTAC